MPKKFVGEPFSVSLISGIEKIYASDGYVTIFRRIFFVSEYRKTLQVNHSVLCFRKIPVAKKTKSLKIKGGVSSFCVKKSLSYSSEKFRR